MNKLLQWAEPKLAVLALLVFSGVLGIASYSNPTFHAARGFGATAAGYTPSPVDPLIKLLRYGIYASTLFLIIARFKTVVRPLVRDPFLWVLVGLAVFSFIWSDFPGISRKEAVLTFMTTLFGVYLASRYSLKEQLQIIAWAAGIAAVFSLLYTLAFPWAGIEQGIHAGAWRGPVTQKNIFARLMVMCAVPLALVLNSSRTKYRYVVWAVFGITVALIVLSTSKTALVVFLTLMMVLPIYRALRWSSSFAVPFLMSLVLVGASTGTWLMTNWVSFLGSLGKDATLTGRTEIWDAIIEKIGERPWLGYGYDAFWQPGGGQDYVWYVFRITFTQSHNGYLDLTVQLGILGLLLFALSFITAYLKGVNWGRMIKTPEGLWPLTYLTFIFMYNQTESTTIETNSIFWILYVSITLSLRHIQLANTNEELEISHQEKLAELV